MKAISNNRNLIIKTLILSIFCFLFSTAAFSQNTYLRHFTTKNGLPSNNCFYTLQDRKGYIWIATDAGVSRFDGKIFETFSINDGLPDNQILQLKEDQNGRIWFLALNGQLSYFHNGKIYNENNNNLLKLLKFNGVIVSFFQDSKGRIWLGTNKNVLIKWDGKSVRKYISADLDCQFINTFVHEDAAGKIWALSNTSIRVFDEKTFNIVSHTSLPLSYKTSLNRDDQTLAFLDKTGLNIRRGNEQNLQLKVDPSLLTNDPGYFTVDEKDGLWLSNAAGIYHIQSDGQTLRYLENVSSSQVIKDTNGNMWFTTTNGIYMLPRKDKRLYIVNKLNGLSSDPIRSIIKDSKNRLWLGMEDGEINIINSAHQRVGMVNLPDIKKYNAIKHLAYDSITNAIYFASDYGLGRINNIYSTKQPIDYLRETNGFIFVIKSFSISHDHKLAMALSSGVVIIPDMINNFKYASKSLKHGVEIFDNRAYRVFYDKDQQLWFSNIDGLSSFANGKLNSYFEKQPILTKRINDIQQLSNGTLVLATDGNGLIFVKNGKVLKVITQLNGLADNICKKLFIKNDNIWVVTNNGINRILFDGENADIEAFEYTDELLNDDVNSLYIDEKNAYFATNNGLVYFTYNKPESKKESPNVYITSILNNKSKLNLRQSGHILDPANNNITFFYSAIDFQNPNILYRYRLKSDASWTETRNRRLEFSSLEPGNYTFEISAKSNNSNWSTPAKVSFVLKSHFWQRTWFLLLFFAIAGIAFYKLAVIVTKRQKNKEQEQLLLKNKILMLEQRALQAMMNPHFVFNVMNSIQHYINTKDTNSANKILTGFAKLIRKNLEICTRSFISLEEELDYLELYLSLEKKRFGDKLVYNIQVSRDIDKEETLVPSMILQPYIENAIWHGIMPREEGGKVDILIELEENDHLLIKIIDDGIGINNSLKSKKGQHQSKGMDLTRERIHLLNQIEAHPIQLDIKQNGISGTFVSISIPLNL